jgi:hypothetical protein
MRKMAAIIAYSMEVGAEQEPHWQPMDAPPLLVQHGPDVFVHVPLSAGSGVRAYVDGMLVVGIQPVREGCFVRIITPGSGQAVSYRVGKRAISLEDGRGRPCEFTGLPITGKAVLCGCGTAVKEEVASEIGVCPSCGEALKDDGVTAQVGEELQ